MRDIAARRIAFATLFVLVLATLTRADGGANHQTRNLHFGVSGGNVNDVSRAFCCSGTLGALVRDASGALYILSNNHVLARTDAAGAGEDITQPGLIDNGCRAATVVANFTIAPPLTSNVDAGVATLVPGTMDETGFIEDVGVPSGIVADPLVGLAVAKSGRTTGLTAGAISSINTNVNVQYQAGCGTGRKFVVPFTNQIAISGSAFSAGGDSGSLIVTNDAARQPVGLLYAGSSTTTFANPAGEVLQTVGATLGRSISFDVTGKRRGRSNQTSRIREAEIARTTKVKEDHAVRLLEDPSVFGVGVGAHPSDPGAAAIVVYVMRGRGRGDIPEQLDEVATVIVETDPIVSYGWNMREAAGGCCAVK